MFEITGFKAWPWLNSVTDCGYFFKQIPGSPVSTETPLYSGIYLSASRYSSSLFYQNMAPKRKYQPSGSKTPTQENPKSFDTLDLDHIPLADQFFKIIDTECEFDMFELHH